MRILILPVVFAAGILASVPVRETCSEDSEILANVQPGDPIQIRHAVNGEAVPCYSVVVTQGGKEVQGFILGLALPAIREFEKTRALESRVFLPAPPESGAKEEKKPPPPPVGPPFEPWSGVDTNGKRMQIVPAKAKATLVVFWNAGSRPAERLVHEVMKTESEFGPKGLRAFGLVGAASAGRANYYLDDMGLDYPQALDRERLASKYNVDAAKGTTLVVDPSNNVVAISSNPAEIRAAVARLLSSE